MEHAESLKTTFHETELRLLAELRAMRRGLLKNRGRPQLALGQRIAVVVAAMMGSWTFILI